MTGIDQETFDRLIADGDVRWVHSISAGVEHLPLDAMAERGILLTNSAGAYASAMAEYTVAGMHRCSPGTFPRGSRGSAIGGGSKRTPSKPRCCRGKRLGIVGYGAVGRELAAAARALGMEVWATKRSPLFISGEPLDRLLPVGRDPRAARRERLRRSVRLIEFEHPPRDRRARTRRDEVVGHARERRPWGPRSTKKLSSMPSGTGAIRGAMLDVTTEEPLPSEQRSVVGPEPPDHTAHLRERPRELAMGGRVLLREPPSLPGRIARADGEPRRLFSGLLT